MIRPVGVVTLSCLLALCACASQGTAGDEQDLTTAAVQKKPSDPIASTETIRVKLSRAGGDLVRVYVPVTVDGRQEHVVLDSGTSRTWFRAAGAQQDFTPNAFVGKVGDSVLSIFGRNVPPSNELVDGRMEIGCIGVDWLSAGPTELDLRGGTLVRHPPGFEVPGTSSWPILRVQQTRGIIHGHVTVDEVEHHVMVDTGAPTTLLIAKPHAGDVPRTAHDVLGNPFTVFDGRGKLVIASQLGPADVAVTSAPTFPHLTEIANALGLPIDGLLGLSSMGDRRVLIDLAAGVVRFEPR